MMLTLHGFPANTKYADVKSLLKQECKIIDFLLDNLVSEGANFKKVRVGLASDAEGYKVMNIINGYQFQGNTLQAVPFGAEPSKPAKPGYQSQEISKFSNQQNNDYQNHPRNDFGPPGNYTRGPGQHNPNPHNQSQFGNSPRIQGHDIGGPHSQGPFGGGPRGLPGTQDDVFRSSGGNQDYSGRHGQWGHEMGPDGPKSQPWANNSSNQWGGDLNAGGPIGQNTYGSQQQNNPYFNQQPMQTENRQYGQDRDRPQFHPQIKAVQSTRGSDIQRNNLRVLEPMEISNTPDRFPTNFHPENKRVTIMKDNFQGPTQYNINNPDGSGPAFRATGNSQPWNQQGQQLKPNPNFDQRKYLQENESRGSPMDRRPSPSDRRISPGRRFSPSGKRVLPPGRRISPTGRRISPTGRRISPTARRISPAGRRFSPGRQISPGRRMSPGRRFSPSGRRLSPSGRRFSPSGRRISPGRQVLPNRKISPSGTHILASRRFSPGGRVSPGRRMSPGRRVSPGRRIMPQGRMASPTGRRISPGRRLSPGTRMSPNRRISPMMANKILTGGDRGVLGHPMRRESPHKRLSPGRRMPSPNRPGMRGDSPSRQHGRYSPVRQALDRTMDKFGPDKMKPIRPAYEPEQAPNQTTYAGGYRPGPPDTVQYPTPGARVGDKRVTPWEKPAPKTDDTQDRRGLDRERERGPDPRADGERPHSSGRRSRSPVRQRSPFSSRFRKPSPSSRSSRSPRRSWALEKRRSPAPVDAPPPPAWPAPEPEPQPQPAPPPVWERHQFSDDKVRAALLERERLSQRSDADRFSQREPRPSPRREFRRESPDRKPFRTDDPRRRAPDDDPRRRAPDDDPRARVDFQHEREPSPRLNLKKSQFLPSIDKDFEDIYHRTLEFKKKAEELRRLNKREKDDVEERSHREREREEESRSFRYDEKRYRPEDQETSRERRHGTDSPTDRNDDHRPVRFSLKSNTKAKREKAVEELVKKMFERHESLKHLKGDQKCRINEELQLAVSRAVYEMFGDNEVSFIEIIIKFQARYSLAGEANMIDDVLKSFPSHIRIPKRHAPEAAEVPSSKVGRRSHTPVKEIVPRPKLADSMQWHQNLPPPEVVTMPMLAMPTGSPQVLSQAMPQGFHQAMSQGLPQAMPQVFPQGPALVTQPPMMVQAPFMMQDPNSFDIAPHHPTMYAPEPVPFPTATFNPPVEKTPSEDLWVYLCQDDFDPFTDTQIEYLKSFLFSEMVKASESSEGWMPEFTIKGIQSKSRYEVVAKDINSREWLRNLDFSQFEFFNVLVYTKEELWYERAAIWLPGHSKCRNIEPLDKLKMQNKFKEGIEIEKWKFVKKIVNAKGTRVYVDMPPSSAKNLEKYKMLLSYELQKVNVFLKAATVDKNAFDLGMQQTSIAPQAEIYASIQNSPMPSIPHEHACVKLTLKGCKTLPVVEARKIKETVIYNIFHYHQQNGKSKTDFTKYGFYPPNYFGIVPENKESERWLLGRHFGKVNRKMIVVVGGRDENVRYFKMSATLYHDMRLTAEKMLDRLRLNNKGVKGLNFNLWQPRMLTENSGTDYPKFEVDIDLESLETLSKMGYKLRYSDMLNAKMYTINLKSVYSEPQLKDIIRKYKAEMTDSYDVANMELDSGDSESDDIICLDENLTGLLRENNRKRYWRSRFQHLPELKLRDIGNGETNSKSLDNKSEISNGVARRSSPVKNTALIMKPPISYNAAQKVGAPGRASRKRNKEKKQKARKTSPAKPALQPIPAKKPVQRAPVKAIIKEEPKEVKKPVEIKKEVEKKEAEDVEVTSAMQTGRYELNELMTRMVEKELQDIMIKVWQVLPDNPPEEEDELVVATFRNEAGDHLRNVLGLNITQRLLNIHNPLYVKVQFSGKPEKADLREFLKKYNFSGFKRIQSAVNMFAAQVKTINDFDRLCTDKDIKCGIAKVTVVPIYKFSKCPPNLITSFNITDEDTDMQSKDNNITDVDNNETSKGTNNPDIIQKPVVVKVEKPDDIQETVENKPKIVNKVDTKPVLENKVDKTTINNQPNDKPTIKNQPNNKPTIKNQPNVKPTIKNEPDDKPTIKNQSNDITTKEKVEAKNNVQNTPTPAAVRKTKPIETKDVKTVETKPVVSEKQLKPVVSEKQVKPVVSGKQMKAVVSEKQVKPMVSEKQVKPVVSEKQVKPVVSEKQVKPVVSEKQMKPSVSEKQVKPVVSEKQVKPVETKPTIVKTPVKATETKKLMTTPSEPKNITPTKNKVTPISKPVAKESKVENDFDELDDYDILALMSEGIVLDECEGSDDD